MSKIVQAVNSMIINDKKISDVVMNDKEIFFKYDNKYTWSIRKDSDVIMFLYFYKTDLPTHALATFDDDDWNNFDGLIIYSTKELNTKESISSFKELYNMLLEKVYGLDDVLNDIIGDF